jgi:hypothetical protein
MDEIKMNSSDELSGIDKPQQASKNNNKTQIPTQITDPAKSLYKFFKPKTAEEV